MATLLTAYFENLRSALGDKANQVGTFTYKDEQLAAALRTIVQTGLGPKGVDVSSDGLSLDPAPSTPDARGYLILNTALSLIGGTTPFSFKTRALSANFDPEERRTTIDHFRRLLQRLETQGDPHGNGGSACFGIWQDMENAICKTQQPERTA